MGKWTRQYFLKNEKNAYSKNMKKYLIYLVIRKMKTKTDIYRK